MKSLRIKHRALCITFIFGFLLLSTAALGCIVYGDDSPTTVNTPSEPTTIAGLEASIAGFLGAAERGPAEPRLLESWEEYSRLYGGSRNVPSYLPYAVKGFFENGGKKLYVARVVDSAASTATSKLLKGKVNALTIRAKGEGSWGNRLQVKVSGASESSKENPMFKLEVNYYDRQPIAPINNFRLNMPNISPSVTEVYDNISLDKKSENYYEYKVNGSSSLITISMEKGDLGILPEQSSTPVFLKGGSDGGSLGIEDYLGNAAGPGSVRGLAALDAIDEISLLYCPDAMSIDGLAHELVAHCERIGDRMVILDSQKGDADPMHDESLESSYAAFYYPWISIDGATAGAQLLVPPGGHIAGIYALTEVQRGIHKSPANIGIVGAKGLEFNINEQRQGILNSRGVNTIREFSGRGIVVWGARTLAAEGDAEHRYISQRRLENYLEESIAEGLAWTANWRNDPELWIRVEACVREFLTREWRKGCLVGSRERDAFFVKVDRSTMNQSDVQEGRLIIQIGVAMLQPAEFNIMRIMLPVQGSMQ